MNRAQRRAQLKKLPAKSAAACNDHTAEICQFHRRLGVSLLAIDDLVNTFGQRRKAT